MDNLPKNLAELKLYLANVKPWAVVAAVAALVVVGFYSLEGYRYWEAWDESRTMTAEIQRINTKLNKGLPTTVGSNTENLDLQLQRLSYYEDMFGQRDISRLIGIISTTSWDTGVELPSIGAGDPTLKEVDGNMYLTQAFSLTVRGDTNDIYHFLSELQKDLPIMSVPDISISQPGPNSSVQIQLLLYLLPPKDQISDDEAAD